MHVYSLAELKVVHGEGEHVLDLHGSVLVEVAGVLLSHLDLGLPHAPLSNHGLALGLKQETTLYDFESICTLN